MQNQGHIDRLARLIVGAVLVVVAWRMLGLAQGEVGAIIAVAVGGILIVTGLIGFCPAYRLLGVRTCPTKQGP